MSERNANAKELERLKMHNSDDLYIPQLKEVGIHITALWSIGKGWCSVVEWLGFVISGRVVRVHDLWLSGKGW